MRASQQQSTAPPSVSVDWRGILGWVLCFVLLTVVGPLPLLLGWLIRVWCRRSLFDMRDRWDSVRTFAWCFGLLLALTLALALIAFHVFPGQALHVWTYSPLHILGAPDLLGNLWLRWIVSTPLAFALALAMGWGETRLVLSFVRIPTEAEKEQLAEKRRCAQEEQIRRTQQAERERAARMAQAVKPATPAQAKTSRAILTASASPPPKTTSRPASSPTQPPGANTPPIAGQDKPTLWDELPDDHPWKQLAQQEQGQSPPSGQVAQPPEQPPKPEKKEKPKPPDLGDGSMDALL